MDGLVATPTILAIVDMFQTPGSEGLKSKRCPRKMLPGLVGMEEFLKHLVYPNWALRHSEMSK